MKTFIKLKVQYRVKMEYYWLEKAIRISDIIEIYNVKGRSNCKLLIKTPVDDYEHVYLKHPGGYMICIEADYDQLIEELNENS